MSTQSTSGFEWSVKLISSGSTGFYIGIASIFKLEEAAIRDYDEAAILYRSDSAEITSRKNTIHSSLPVLKTGDVIRFRFQPLIKKLIIELVRFCKSAMIMQDVRLTHILRLITI